MKRARTAAGVALLFAASHAGAERIEAFAIGGPPQVANGPNAAGAALRDVGFRVESPLFAAEVRAPACGAATGRGNGDAPVCGTPNDAASPFTGAARRAALTFKVPPIGAALPTLDLSLRHWSAASHEAGEGARGTSLEAVMSRSVGPFSASVAVESPFRSARDGGRWRSVAAGFGWTGASGWSLDVDGVRSRDIDVGDIERSLRMRLAWRVDGAGARVAVWVRRYFDDAATPWRAGVTATARF